MSGGAFVSHGTIGRTQRHAGFGLVSTVVAVALASLTIFLVLSAKGKNRTIGTKLDRHHRLAELRDYLTTKIDCSETVATSGCASHAVVEAFDSQGHRIVKAPFSKFLDERYKIRTQCQPDGDGSAINIEVLTKGGWRDLNNGIPLYCEASRGGLLVAAGCRAVGPMPVCLYRLNDDGTRDMSYNGTGELGIPLASEYGRLFSKRGGGKILLTGDMSLMGLDKQGELDATFGTNGETPFTMIWPHSNSARVARDSLGNTYYTAQSSIPQYFYVQKFRPDGSPDVTFGVGGQVRYFGSTEPQNPKHGCRAMIPGDIAIQADGRIVLAVGVTDCSNLGFPASFTPMAGLMRLMPDGSPDPSFVNPSGAPGFVPSLRSTGPCGGFGAFSADGLAVQSDGKIVVAYTTRAGFGVNDGVVTLNRFNSDGTVDSTFNSGFNSSPCFSTGGPATYPGGAVSFAGVYRNIRRTVAIQPDGKILTAGNRDVLRATSSGVADATFGTAGVVTGVFRFRGAGWLSDVSILVEDSGKFYVGGMADGFSIPQDDWSCRVFRFNEDGTQDATWTSVETKLLGQPRCYFGDMIELD